MTAFIYYGFLTVIQVTTTIICIYLDSPLWIAGIILSVILGCMTFRQGKLITHFFDDDGK